MKGYLYPKYLKDTFDNDGYFQTGDIAEIDDEGYVIIYDRRKRFDYKWWGEYLSLPN